MSDSLVEDASQAQVVAAPKRRFHLPRNVLLAALVFAVHSVSPTPQIGDSRLSVVTAWQFIHHLNLHLESYPVVTGLVNRYDLISHGGHLLPYFPWPTMLVSIPADIVYWLTGHHPQLLAVGPQGGRTWLLEVPTASLLVALTAVMIREIVRDMKEPWGRPRVALAAALVYAFCTSAWSVGSRALWQQTVSMFFLTAILLALQRLDRRWYWPWLLGACLALAYMTRPTNAVIVVLAGGWVVWRRRAALPAMLATFTIGMVLFFVVSLTQYGQPLPPYYGLGRLNQGPTLSFGNALLAYLISPSRGLFIYDPVLLLAVVGFVVRVRTRRLSELDVLISLAIVAQLVVISRSGLTGGASYGPRLLVDDIPYLVVLSAPVLSFFLDRARRPAGLSSSLAVAGIALVLTWSLFVNATGGVLRSSLCWNNYPVTIDAQPSRIWSWSGAQFLSPYQAMAAGRSLHQELTGSCAVLDSRASR